MDQVNLKVDSTQSIGFFSRLQQAQPQVSQQEEPPKQEEPSNPIPITSKEPPKPVPITSKEPPKPVPITSKEPPKPVPITSKEPPKPIPITSTEPPKPIPVTSTEDHIEPLNEKETSKSAELADDQMQFINKLNSEPRAIGHNKFQVRIAELEKLIEENKRGEQESEMKINLFKKTISTLQSQLQDKSAHIARLETRHIDPQYEKQIVDLNQHLKEKNNGIEILKSDILNIQRENDFLQQTCKDITSQRDTALQQLEDMKQRHVSLETSHQRQAIQLQMNVETLSKMENRLNLEENLRNNLQNELDSLKTELVTYRTDIANLTVEKDNEIQRLRDLLENWGNEQRNSVSDPEPIVVSRSIPTDTRKKRLTRNTGGFRK